MFMKW